MVGEGFQQFYVLKTFPSTLKDEVNGRKKEGEGKKKGERGRKKLRRKQKIIFSKVLGKVSTMLCLENLPQHLKK